MNETFTGTLVGSAGSRLVVRDAELAAAPAPTPSPTPSPAGRQRLLWDYGWQALDVAALPPDVPASLTHVSMFVAQSAAAGTGRLKAVPGATRARVAAWRAAGLHVDLCIGGAKDGGITATTAAQAAEMTASIRAQVQACGYTGVDLDLEPSGGKWGQDAILAVARAALADGLQVHLTTALYGPWTANWGAVAKALGASLTSWRVMLYNFDEAADSRLTAVTTSKLATMRGYLAREDQLVACYATGAASVASTPAVARAAYAAARAKYPSAGFGLWHGGVERSRGWSGLRALAGV